MVNPVDPVLSHYTSQERKPSAVPELPNDQPLSRPSKVMLKVILNRLKPQAEKIIIIIIIIINSLTARVIGAPQTILQPVFSIFPVLYCPPGLSFPDVVFPPLPVSALSSSSFHCALQDGFGQT